MSAYGLLSEPARAARFWAGVDQGEADECWPWTRATNPMGYGVVGVTLPGRSRSSMGAHVVAWTLHNGRDVPAGMVVDHLCRTRACCNPLTGPRRPRFGTF